MKIDGLETCLSSYKDAAFVVNGFRHGFTLGVKENPQLRPHRRVRPLDENLQLKVNLEVDKGRIIGPFKTPLISNLMISPVSVIKKANSNKLRMILNLSDPLGFSINDNIPKEYTKVNYCTVKEVAQWLGYKSDCFLAKVDLSEAYRMVPINNGNWKYLGMRVGENIYIDRCLPMGASSSCATFQRISDALAWWMAESSPVKCTIFNYLDDFLIIATGLESSKCALDNFIDQCDKLGVPLATNKTVRSTQRLTFLGLGIDARHQTLFIPLEKAKNVLSCLDEFLSKNTQKVKFWQSVLGKLCHLTEVVTAGRAYLGSVYGSLKGILSTQQHKIRHIKKEAREDLEVWRKFLTNLPPEKPFRIVLSSTASLVIHTDAAQSKGYGAICGHAWIAGFWPSKKWEKINIAVLELYPIYAAIHQWTKDLSDQTIAVYTDNKAVVEVLNRLYAKDKHLRCFLKPIALWVLNRNLVIRAVHIEGKENIGPDLISRGKHIDFLKKFPQMNNYPDKLDKDLRPEAHSQLFSLD